MHPLGAPNRVFLKFNAMEREKLGFEEHIRACLEAIMSECSDNNPTYYLDEIKDKLDILIDAKAGATPNNAAKVTSLQEDLLSLYTQAGEAEADKEVRRAYWLRGKAAVVESQLRYLGA